MKITSTRIEMDIEVYEPDDPDGIDQKAAVEAADQYILSTLGPAEFMRWHYSYTTWRNYNKITVTYEQ